jgi:SIR2-like protein
MNLLQAPIARQPRLHRYLCHLYQRLDQGRLNLVTGAGISVNAGVPSWYALLDRLAERTEQLKDDFQLHRKAGLNPEYLGQIIFHRMRKECPTTVAADMREATINHAWAHAIYEALYKDVPDDIEVALRQHPYLTELRDLARKVPLVINFNFDDILADAVGHQASAHNGTQERPFTVVWHPPLVDRPYTTTIYHVNGVLPHVGLKKRSPQLIFTEDSFADALARAPSVSAEYVFLRFVQNTMLIIGHSLNDTSLKNLLRKNRDKSPANHHYMIYWLEKPDSVSEHRMGDIFEANLELYNLVTIFLTSEEIKAFLSLLIGDEREFRDALDEMGTDKRHRYHYYIAGPVASGKSSLLEHLRCFATYEEWTRPPPSEMYLSFDQLKAEDAKKVDGFVYGELKEKNRRMHDAGVGFHFMDRAPLDLYAFSKDDEERKRKTMEIKEIVTRDKALQAGEIVFVTARGETLVKRNLGRGRMPTSSGTATYLDDQGVQLFDIYQPATQFSTDELSSGEVARKVARHALLEDYAPLDLDRIMERFA